MFRRSRSSTDSLHNIVEIVSDDDDAPIAIISDGRVIPDDPRQSESNDVKVGIMLQDETPNRKKKVSKKVSWFIKSNKEGSFVQTMRRQISELSMAFSTDTDNDGATAMSMAGIANKTITEFIRMGNLSRLDSFLESKHLNVDEPDENGNTPLMVACNLGQLDFVSLLIRHGADVNAENEDKCTSLHIAASAGHVEVCAELLDAGANIDQPDIGLWTPYIWACYRNRLQVVQLLLSRGADVHAKEVHHISGLIWAAGRGDVALVRLLLENNIKVDVGDKYGTTALIWACRKGRTEVVELLLRAGANVDVVGMYSWTPLLVATRGNYVDVVNLLLDEGANINAVDKDGFTALAIACKEGFEAIALKLLSAGAYTNTQDKAGDTNLIHATKGGHQVIVDALLKKYADVNIRGKEHKTCLHWAIDKNHPRIVKMILASSPDLEAKTIDGDTPLLRAVRVRNPEIVQMLLDRKAKITACDSKGDTVLHIAMRARSKTLVEILLRNPKHSQLLYKPNRQGETPYDIDVNSPKTILGQVFGARRLNTNEDSENILGYDLYSSALTDILTEPSLSLPITVGLYAKWGSGKSFLLNKLQKEMKSFTRDWVDPSFHMSPLLFFTIIQIAIFLGVAAWMLAFLFMDDEKQDMGLFVGLGVAIVLFLISYAFIYTVWKGTLKYDWQTLYNLSMMMTKQFKKLKLILNVIFCHPPGSDCPQSRRVQPLRLHFTDQTKVITSTGGQNSVTQMIGSLLDAIENQYGKVATRLYRVVRPKARSMSSQKMWRKFCCIPYIVLYSMFFLAVMAEIILLCLFFEIKPNPDEESMKTTTSNPLPVTDGANVSVVRVSEVMSASYKMKMDFIRAFLIAVGTFIGIILVSNVYTLANCIQSLYYSQRKHLQHTVAKLDMVKSEGYLQAVKSEVLLMLDTVKCLDAFTNQQSRLVVIVDGLDSCEQSKVLSVLDAVHMLFSDPGSPFIIILAIDPHVITKAIELNLNQVFSDTSIGGNAYLRNLVHLPFFLQNSGLRKVKTAQQLSSQIRSKSSNISTWVEVDEGTYLQRRLSNESNVQGLSKRSGSKYQKKASGRSRAADSVSSSLGSNLNKTGIPQGPQDLTKVLLNDDYFNDVNPRSMRRLMNVVYVMGRLLKAFHIDFNWYHLANWVNITEQWPYRLSWIILYTELFEEEIDDTTSLKVIYDKVKPLIPTQKEIEPLLELDRDEKKLDTFLSFHKKNMTLIDLKIFLPFTINLDPYIKKVLREEVQSMEEMGVSVDDILNNSDVTNTSSNRLTTIQAPNAPLTRRQAVGLSKKLSIPEFSGQSPGIKPPIPMFHPNPNVNFWPYNNQLPQAYPPVHPLHPFVANRDPNSRQSTPEKTSPLVNLPDEVYTTALSQKTIEDICHVIHMTPGLTAGLIGNYGNTIRTQNLSGAVLSNCNLEDLKGIMNMSFGDWEIFKLLITTLRKQEKHLAARNVKFSLHPGNDIKITSASVSPGTVTSTAIQSRPGSGVDEVVETLAGSNSKLAKLKQQKSIVERQVTMEEAMISGLLSTLNEEAQEDIICEERRKEEEEQEEQDVLSSACLTDGNNSEFGFNMSSSNSQKGESDVVFISHKSPSSNRLGHQMSTTEANIEAGLPESGSKWLQRRASKTGAVSGTSSWANSQSDLIRLGLNSVPTSPTATTQSHPTPRASLIHQQDVSEAMNKRKKMRYMRDRLDSLSGASDKRITNLNNLDYEEDGDDPYAWLSQTAPASPHMASKFPHRAFALDYADEDYGERKNSNSWLFDTSLSIEKLGETSRKLKKKLMPTSSQRSRRTSINSSSANEDVPLVQEKPGLLRRLTKKTSFGSPTSKSHHQRLEHENRDVDESDTEADDVNENTCSTPEEEDHQVTVSRRPTPPPKGRHVQEIFGNHAYTVDSQGDFVTVLPDGQIMRAEISDSEGPSQC